LGGKRALRRGIINRQKQQQKRNRGNRDKNRDNITPIHVFYNNTPLYLPVIFAQLRSLLADLS